MSLSLKKQLSIMSGIAIAAISLLALLSYLLAKNTAIGSEQSLRINYAFELTADILPPPLYLLETMKTVEELVNASPSDRVDLTKHTKKLMDEYNQRIKRWSSKQDLPKNVVDFIEKKLDPTSQDFIRYVNNTVLPAALAGDNQAFLATSAGLTALYNKHRSAIDQLVEMANEFVASEQAEAVSSVGLYKNMLYLFSLVFVVAVLGCSFYFSKQILSGLGADPSELQHISNAVAKGDLDVSLPSIDNKNSVLAATALMIDSLRDNLATARENQRIRTSLDSASTNVMITNSKGVVVYLNGAMEKMLRTLEADIRRSLPQFSASNVSGGGIDIFNTNLSFENLSRESKVTTVIIATLNFRVMTNPIRNDRGEILGVVCEWLDRTQEIAAETEINNLVEKAAQGDFSARIDTHGKSGFFLKTAEGLNALVTTTHRGLADVVRVLGAVAKGDLTERMTDNYAGTFAELKDYCNNTTDSLTEIMQEIRSAADAIFTASSEIAAGNSDLSTRTEQQAANLEETASSTEELTSTVKLNADNAKQANVLAERASVIASDGGALIQQVVVTMNSINESSQKIADIIGVIDGIAFQTNILALNAAVEAARAGDQGRGFAVVASEVRALAQRSANAAKDIKGLISDSVKKIESGNVLVVKSGDTMKEVVVSIKRVNDIMAEIAAASSEQSTGIEEVSNAVSQMDEMTQQNAALVEEAAAAAESLQSQADQLTQRVGTFKLSADAAEHHSIQEKHHRSPVVVKKIAATGKKLLPQKNQDDEWESF